MMNQATFGRMRQGALFVNVARGDLVQMDDLVSALSSGRLSGAGLDVTDPEPLNKDSPLLGMPNVIITNHVAAASVTAIRKLRTSVAQTVVTALRGDPLPNVVNGVPSGDPTAQNSR
jgi:phosphoglycerate dehydrogenase-like enzyme